MNFLKKIFGIKNILPNNNTSQNYKDLVVLGSSSTELFDYIFGDNPQYHPFWASGWCIRHLKNKQNYQDYIRLLLNCIKKDSIIFLNFGNADIDFILRRKIYSLDFTQSDIEQFGLEIIDGIIFLKEFLISLGFSDKNIYCVFANPPVDLDDNYWLKFDGFPAIDLKIRSNVHLKVMTEILNFINVIDATPNLVDKKSELFVLDKKFMKTDYDDHHQDYSKTQKIVWEEIQKRNIIGLITARTRFHTCLYPHEHEEIDDLVKKCRPRLRTCY